MLKKTDQRLLRSIYRNFKSWLTVWLTMSKTSHWTQEDMDAVKEFKKSMEKGVETIYFKSPKEFIVSRD